MTRKNKKGIIIDIAVPADVRVEEKEKENVEKYQDLKKEIEDRGIVVEKSVLL